MGGRKQARDEEFQSFVIGRWPRLMRTAFLLTGERHAAEDLVQTTLERACVAWLGVGSADDPDTYVRRVMINAHARRHRRRLNPRVVEVEVEGAGASGVVALAPRGRRASRRRS